MEAGVHGRAALEQDGADPSLPERASQPVWLGMVSRRDQHLGTGDLRRTIPPDHHQPRLVGREPALIGRNRSLARDEHAHGLRRTPGCLPNGRQVGRKIGPAVDRAEGSDTDGHRVIGNSQEAHEPPVSPIADVVGGSVALGAAIQAGDHVQPDPRPIGWSSRQSQIGVGGVQVQAGSGIGP